MLKKFFANVLPAMLSFAFTGLYAIVDGFFVGRNTGDAGLAAISLAFPLGAVIAAVGTGIGMGGAVQISINRGKGNTAQEKLYLGNTLCLLAIACVVVMAVLFLIYQPTLKLLGASGELFTLGKDYLTIIISGTVFQLFATGLLPILRNYGATLLAMTCMIIGFVTNIILDAYFVGVLKLGISGAAWATIIGQALTLVGGLIFIIRKTSHIKNKSYKLIKGNVGHILKTGISPFGLSMSPNIVAMLINKSAVIYGGEIAVAAFSVVGYVYCIIQLLLQGIGDGSQPLMSFYLGKKELHNAKKIRNFAFVFALIVSSLNFVLFVLLKTDIPAFFGGSQSVIDMASTILPLFAFGALFLAVSRVITSYFYSIHENTFAYILVYGELLLLLILLLIIPVFAELTGVWLSVPTSLIVLMIIGLAMLKYKENRTIVQVKNYI